MGQGGFVVSGGQAWPLLQIFLLLFFVFACSVASVMSDSLQPYGLYSLQAPLSWDSQGKNTGVTTQEERVGGEGLGWGDTCILVTDSC